MQKKIILIVLAFILVPTAVFSQADSAQFGISLLPSTFGPGLGVRYWTASPLGFGVEGATSWGFDDLSARARLMYALSEGERGRLYLLATGGFTSISDKNDGYEFSVSFPSFAVGAGYEWMKGRSGFSLEAGFQIGRGKYTISYDVPYYGYMQFTDTYKMLPIYIGFSYTLYLN